MSADLKARATAMCERLRRSVVDTTTFCPSPEYRNPDGLEAAALIEELIAPHGDEGLREAWRVIETAPPGNSQDGPFFDVTWVGDTHRYLPVPSREVDCYREGNIIKRKHGYPALVTIFIPQPTHWMPGPPAALEKHSKQSSGERG